MALSWARHTYEEWVVNPVTDLSGNDMESAPRWLGNARLSWRPVPDTRVQLEWVGIGPYWQDQTNTVEYEGHSIFNLRANWALSRTLALFGSVHNLADLRYAESASVSSGTPVYAPGLPRTLYAGIEYRWGAHLPAPAAQP
jgi:outer membrane receptor protein involved in Fe transport